MTRIRAIQWGAVAASTTFGITVLAVLAFLQGQSATNRPTPAPATPAVMAPAPAPFATAPGDDLRVTNDVLVYRKVKDAVVNITSSHTMTVRGSTGNPLFDSMLPPEALGTRQVQTSSLGSGFVIHPAGYIITNEHVVEQGTEIQCVFCNGDKLDAQVIATDDEHDLAVLKVTPPAGKPLQAIALGASEDLEIGEPAYAIGNPFGYAGTMTRGIISAVNRTLNVSANKSYSGLIQTDCSINPGNSGGPLLNAYGQVIGINTAIRADAQGIGFAISVSQLRDLLPTFLNTEALNRAQIGFTLEEKRQTGPRAAVTATILVKQVQITSAAEKQGLKAGDQILRIGGVQPTSIVDALVALSTARQGEDLGVQVLRGTGVAAKDLSFLVPVTKAPPPPVEALLLSKMGIKGQTITPALASKFHLSTNQGVYIDTVDANSPAAKCGLQTGDVLYQLGRYYVNSTDDVAALLKTVKDPVDARIGVVRGNQRGAGTISLK
jgi:serine protease Do